MLRAASTGRTSLNPLGDEIIRPPVTLPRLRCLDIDDADQRKEAAELIAQKRVVRSGLEAWIAIGKAESFEGWRRIGAALAIGKQHALRVMGANAAWGRNYSREFSAWVKLHGFERMPGPTRSVAIELHEHAQEIEAWRSTLPEKQRKRLIHPLSNVRRWRHATTGNGRSDVKRDAAAAWKRFRFYLEAMPRDEATTLWRSCKAEITLF